jgi:hypothetical protein
MKCAGPAANVAREGDSQVAFRVWRWVLGGVARRAERIGVAMGARGLGLIQPNRTGDQMDDSAGESGVANMKGEFGNRTAKLLSYFDHARGPETEELGMTMHEGRRQSEGEQQNQDDRR